MTVTTKIDQIVRTKNDVILRTITYDVTNNQYTDSSSSSNKPTETYNVTENQYTDSSSSSNKPTDPDPSFVYTLREALHYFRNQENTNLIDKLIHHKPVFYTTTYLPTPVYASTDQLPYSNYILKTMALFGSMCGLYKYVDCDMYDYPELQNNIYSDYTGSSAFGSLIGIPMRRTAQYLALIPGIIIGPIILVGAFIGLGNMS